MNLFSLRRVPTQNDGISRKASIPDFRDSYPPPPQSPFQQLPTRPAHRARSSRKFYSGKRIVGEISNTKLLYFFFFSSSASLIPSFACNNYKERLKISFESLSLSSSPLDLANIFRDMNIIRPQRSSNLEAAQ